jgi:hypothetical protein
MLAHCVAAGDRAAVIQALDALGDSFIRASAADRPARVARIDEKVLALLKELTLLGYFTSEVGATKALAYEAVPGDYRGCVDLRPGQRAWATR